MEDLSQIEAEVLAAFEREPIDRTGWDAGVWDNEPDIESWRTTEGFVALVARHRSGHLCGYLGVDRKQAGKLSQEVLPAHGGITYNQNKHPLTGVADGRHWFGFDAAHHGDYVPGFVPFYKKMEMSYGEDSTYRDLGYVRSNLNRLSAYAYGALTRDPEYVNRAGYRY